MSKKTPGSKWAMKQAKEKYRKERERARQKRARRLEEEAKAAKSE